MRLPDGPFGTIVADPPWEQGLTGTFQRKRERVRRLELAYRTMTLDEIAAMRIAELAEPGTHLWLWATNQKILEAFEVMRRWGFTYLSMITWVKPSGMGAWFANTTQHCLFGYYQKCRFPLSRWKPTHFFASTKPGQHSRKPDEFYDLVKEISPGPRIDLFNRREIDGFMGWGDESPSRPRE